MRARRSSGQNSEATCSLGRALAGAGMTVGVVVERRAGRGTHVVHRRGDVRSHVVTGGVAGAFDGGREAEDVRRSVTLDDEAAQVRAGSRRCSGDSRRDGENRFSTGIATKAASIDHGLRLNSSRMKPAIICARPSEAFNATLPTKPSQTTTSTVPLKMSLPSTLPWKLRWPRSDAARMSSPASFTVSLPLMSSSPMFSRPTVGRALPVDRGDQRAAHDGELQQVLGRAIYVRAEVEHRGGTAGLVGQQRRDRGAVDAVERLQHVAGDGHQRAGVSGRDAGGRATFLDEPDRDAHRGIALLAQRDLDRVVHLDDFGRTDDLDARAIDGFLGREARLDGGRIPTRMTAKVGVTRQELQRSGNRDRQAMITAHNVDRDAGRHGWLWAFDARTRCGPRDQRVDASTGQGYGLPTGRRTRRNTARQQRV